MIRVLIVDDSVVFRTQIAGALGRDPEIEVVATAPNGNIALQRLGQHKVDVVTLDMEMPDMNGIEVLKAIRTRGFPVRVIIFSSQTQRGAEAALRALREGADDVVAKPSGDNLSFESAAEAIQGALLPKVRQFKRKSLNDEPVLGEGRGFEVARSPAAKRDLKNFRPAALVIGSSTGGPTALEHVFKNLGGPVNTPILIVQHMPPVFTEILARRLGEISGIPAHEAKDGMQVDINNIYVAPGDYHMVLEGSAKGVKIHLNRTEQRNSVRPAVDYLFESAAAIYGAGCLGVVLTGMGEDGLIGAKAIRRQNGPIVIQNKESCVVFGMPGAIFNADEYDQMGNLDDITSLLTRLLK